MSLELSRKCLNLTVWSHEDRAFEIFIQLLFNIKSTFVVDGTRCGFNALKLLKNRLCIGKSIENIGKLEDYSNF